MPRTILLDANVIDQINRGNVRAANALRGMIRIGDGVSLGQQAYLELVFHPEPRRATANEALLKRLNLRPATGAAAARAGEPPLAAQARALKAEVWSFADAFRAEPAQAAASFGVKVAPESHTIPLVGADGAAADYRTGFRALGLPPVEITPAGKVVG